MDSARWVIPLAEAAAVDEQWIGGKTAQLARLQRAGFRIAPGFCVAVAAYEQFLQGNKLPRIIQMELGRKPFEELRWEELWDAALRIRNRSAARAVEWEVWASRLSAVAGGPQFLEAFQTLPRQLVGQPAAHGLASGSVRVIRGPQDLGGFRAGEVLVCDAIQPMMTHLVPLAAAVVERRGGMLIRGAIIARELGIPCVNGVAHVVDVLQDGDCVTVDGYLGIVTLGAAEFRLEMG